MVEHLYLPALNLSLTGHSENHRMSRAAPHMLVCIEFGSSVTVAGHAVADSRGQDPDQIVLPVAGRRKESMY